jgi:hypothetical protein
MTSTNRRMRARAARLALALLAGLTGCSGGGSTMPPDQTFTPDQARRFVIARGDLPSDFKVVGSDTATVPCDSDWLANKGASAQTTNEAAVKQQLLALGPQRCHRSVFQKVVRDEFTAGVSVTGFGVFAVVFPSFDAASKALPLLRASSSDPLLRESYAEDADDLAPAEDLLSPDLGDQSVTGIKRTALMPGGPDEYTFVWRVRNVAVVLEGAADLGEAEILKVAQNISARVLE